MVLQQVAKTLKGPNKSSDGMYPKAWVKTDVAVPMFVCIVDISDKLETG